MHSLERGLSIILIGKSATEKERRGRSSTKSNRTGGGSREANEVASEEEEEAHNKSEDRGKKVPAALPQDAGRRHQSRRRRIRQIIDDEIEE